MQTIIKVLTLSGLFTLSSHLVIAAESTDPDPYETDRQQMRNMLAEVERGINERDISLILNYMDDNVIITHQNAHVAKGKAEVKSYNEKMMSGPKATIKSLTTKASVGGPAIFHGDSAIAYGTAIDNIELTSGKKFQLKVAWTASLVKKEGQWKASAIHFSTNALDNAILNMTRSYIWYGTGGGAVLGLILGWFFGRRKT